MVGCVAHLPLGRQHEGRRNPKSGGRRGASVVELAICLPLLVFLFVIAVDFARVYYVSITLANSARAGALYASDPTTMDESPYASVSEAALADATNLTPAPAISHIQGTDSSGRAFVEVRASYTFTTISQFPGVPNSLQLTRRVRMARNAISPTSF
jgi:Flp pilus assembly protein TadG